MKRSTALLGVIHGGVCGLLFSAAVTVFTVSLSPAIGAQEGELPPVAEVEIDFSEHIKPILRKTCIRCHGPKKQKSEYRLDSREAALAGGEIGKGIIVGNSAESPLIKYVSGLDEDLEMPPSGDPLTSEEIGLLRAWIDQGLKWPATAKIEVVQKKLEKATLQDKSERVTSVAFCNSTGLLASAGGQSLPFRPGGVTVWDPATGKEVIRIDGHDSMVWAVAFSPDGKKLATGTYNKIVKILDASDGKELAKLEGHKNWVTALAFSPDGNTLATGSEDATIKLWNVGDGKEIATLSGHGGTVRSLAFSKDGQTLFSGSQDKTIKVWDLKEKKEKSTLQGHEDGVFSIAISPDGETLASASADRTIRIWTLADGKELKKIQGHKNWVISVSFAENGQILATGGYDKLIKIWDLDSGRELRSYPGHESAVWSLVFTSDGDLASGSQDGTVKIWDLRALAKGRRGKIRRF